MVMTHTAAKDCRNGSVKNTSTMAMTVVLASTITSHTAVDLSAVYNGSLDVPERSSLFLRFIRAFDFDNDGSVKAPDFNAFAGCFTGSNGTLTDGPCEAGDFDGDGDIDCNDWNEFTMAWQGPGPSPELLACNMSVPSASHRSLLAMLMAFVAVGGEIIRRRQPAP